MYVQIVYYLSPILNVSHCMHYVRPIYVCTYVYILLRKIDEKEKMAM